jgi:type VII secretion integral membrane protein EccD
MTEPPTLSELNSEAESGPQLTRVTVVVGGLPVDVGLPGNVSIAAIIGEVIAVASAQSAQHADSRNVEFDDTVGKWTLARLGGEPIDPSKSLAEADVVNGDMLVVREVGIPSAPLLFDDVEVTPDDPSAGGRDRQWIRDALLLGCCAVSLVTSVAAALMVPRQTPTWVAAAAALTIGAIGIVVACIMPYRSTDTRRSAWLAAAALPLVIGGSLHIVPGGFGATSLPMAFGLTGFVALVVLLICGYGRAFYTALIGLSVLGVPTTVATLLWDPPARTIGAILATVSVIVVYLAPRATIALSKVPIPTVPTAGEPLDEIEMQGGTTVEGVNAIGTRVIPTEEAMIGRVRWANQYLTGIVVAATAVAVAGSFLAVDVSSGFYWQGTAFAITVSTVLCLRGRSHHDLVQAATLIGGGLLIALAVIVKTATYVDGWRVNSALALVALMGLIVGCGLIATRLEFSPVMRRLVEILEYVAIGLLFPLCFWITRLYAYFRELQI